jgi:ABC-type glutathione transport system ATPase component
VSLNPAIRIGSQLDESLELHDVGDAASRRSRIAEMLEEVRLPEDRWFLRRYPHELSGGQQQRVAVARALASRPAVVFADEPTGNLDSRTSTDILDLLRRSVDEFGQTIVMVTHDATAAAYADRLIVLRDGLVAHDGEGARTEAEVHDLMKAQA